MLIFTSMVSLWIVFYNNISLRSEYVSVRHGTMRMMMWGPWTLPLAQALWQTAPHLIQMSAPQRLQTQW